VDDFAPWRRFVSTIAQIQPGWHVISEASDGLEAVQKAEELTPDLILLDISVPKLSGIEAARQIRKVAPNSKILFVSTHASWEIAEGALDTGASGYVIKADARKELAKAVEAVFQGKRYISSRLKGRPAADPEDTQVPRPLRVT
jgi:DNA-binding NarL/FixJ family response regulator